MHSSWLGPLGLELSAKTLLIEGVRKKKKKKKESGSPYMLGDVGGNGVPIFASSLCVV